MNSVDYSLFNCLKYSGREAAGSLLRPLQESVNSLFKNVAIQMPVSMLAGVVGSCTSGSVTGIAFFAASYFYFEKEKAFTRLSSISEEHAQLSLENNAQKKCIENLSDKICQISEEVNASLDVNERRSLIDQLTSTQDELMNIEQLYNDLRSKVTDYQCKKTKEFQSSIEKLEKENAEIQEKFVEEKKTVSVLTRQNKNLIRSTNRLTREKICDKDKYEELETRFIKLGLECERLISDNFELKGENQKIKEALLRLVEIRKKLEQELANYSSNDIMQKEGWPRVEESIGRDDFSGVDTSLQITKEFFGETGEL
jgi:hypothetical protein